MYMKKKFLLSLLFLFFYNSILFAEVIKNIEISGNQRVSDETIKVYGKLKTNTNYNDEDYNKVLKNLMILVFLRKFHCQRKFNFENLCKRILRLINW